MDKRTCTQVWLCFLVFLWDASVQDSFIIWAFKLSLYTFLFHVCFRAKLDDNARLLDFTQKLEAACIGAVESGKMTKDLALLVHGSSKYVVALSVLYPIHNTCISDFVLTDFCCSVTRSHYLNTEEFIDAVADELRSRLAANSNLWNPCWCSDAFPSDDLSHFSTSPFSFLLPPPWRPVLNANIFTIVPGHYQWDIALDSATHIPDYQFQ